MSATVITLEPPCALISANDRLHRHLKARLTRTWRVLSASTVNSEWHAYHYPTARITVSIRFATNHRRDVGNYYPTAKAIVDGLVDANLLPDDDDLHIVGPDLRRERPNGPPRVTVTIESLEMP